MKKIFLDTNILVDFVANRKPFGTHAAAIFKLAESGSIQLYCSSHSLATTYYLLKKITDDQTLRRNLTDLMDQLSIIPIDEDMMRKSLKQAHRDFEDGIQMNAASSIVRMQYIITRNLRDFKNSDITAVSAEDYLLREHKA